jgi:hypothetical protein
MPQQSTHESYARDQQAVPSSDRSFAVVMAAALAVLGSINWWHDGGIWPWMVGTAVVVALLGYLSPAIFRPLNWLWFKLGLLLHALVSPVLMGLLFYGVVWPTGAIMRACGKDTLRLRMERDRDSYWIKREPPGPEPASMKDQF